jgi:6-phospho-3-hexuloisomerase
MSYGCAEQQNYSSNRTLILRELEHTLAAVDDIDAAGAVAMLLAANRIFTIGAGRSGLALEMAAMRLMHLGLTVHVAGEVTAPAISRGDVLLVASASGLTPSAVHAAEVARQVGASVLVITAASKSRLNQLGHFSIVIPAATKQDHSRSRSEQYAGALFEQSVLLLTDSMFQLMWRERGETAETLWKRHANLE